MATQTLTTGTFDAPVNYDAAALSGLNNGETINLNGGHLLLDGDVRWGYNAAVFGSLVINSSLGGSIQMDGTRVWEVPFTGGTGNVPAVAEAGSNGVTGSGFTGELLRVWATGELTPRNPGTAMPATGWIKLREKTGNASGQLTLPGGARVTASNAGKRSWIHLVGAESASLSVPRLGLWRSRGDWYELGTTSGNANQTFQFPVTDACVAIQIETAPNSSVYEWWMNIGDRWGGTTQLVATDARGKFFGHNNATGVITLARRDTVDNGMLPPSGCRVRIPNIICSTSRSADWNSHTLHATISTRFDITTTASGGVDISHLSCNWYLSLTAAYSISISDSAILNTVVISSTPTEPVLTNCALGFSSGAALYQNLTVSVCLTGFRIDNCRLVRDAGAAGTAVTCASVSDCVNVRSNDSAFEVCGQVGANNRGHASNSPLTLNRISNLVINRPVFIGGRVAISGGLVGRINDSQCADLLCGETQTSYPLPGSFWFDNGATDFLIDGVRSFADLPNVHPYVALLYVGGMCDRVEMRNVGTASVRYNAGTVNPMAYFAQLVSGTRLALRRMYTTDSLRTSPIYAVNVVQGVVADNVYADGGKWQSVTSCETLCRGCGWRYNLAGGTSVYGRHWEDVFYSDAQGEINLLCNEPLPSTVDQVEITAGTPAFTSTGQLAMPNVGDEAVFTMPYFALGVTGLWAGAPSVGGTNLGNISVEFQYDKGDGWNGTWLIANAANLSGIGAVDPAIGLRLRIRLRCITANASNSIIGLRITTTTNATARWTQYPLPRTQLTIGGFEPGSDIVIYNADVVADGSGSNVLATGDAVSGSFSFDYDGTPHIKIGAFKPGFIPQMSPTMTLPSSNSTYTIQQRPDRNYS